MVERKLPSQFLTSHRRSHARAERPSGILAARSLRPCRRWFRVFQMALAGLLVAIATNTSHAAREVATDANGGSVVGLIVRYDDATISSISATQRHALGVDRAAQVGRLTRSQGSSVTFSRTMAGGSDLLQFDRALSLAESEALAAMVAQLPGVRYVAPNRIIRPQLTPTDPNFGSQWGFRYVPGSEEGANFVSAWDITQGNAAQTIGIIDSGISRSNEELAPQLRVHPLFPNAGYDFFSNASSSGDGDGRDNDPEQATESCGHGTHVAGTIAASTTFAGTGVGVAGGASASRIMMARALNSFSGTDADAIDAMHWLAGGSVPGVAINPNIPSVVNMSFGGQGACGGGYQEAVDALRAAGVVPVAAAGNNGQDASTFAPANCQGTLVVAASDAAGNRAIFFAGQSSNFGSGVTLTAPGKDILSTGGSGGVNNSCYKSGTSMAAPHVTAAAALLRSVYPALTVGQVTMALKAGARAFPAGSTCNTAICGAGLLDARGALDTVTGNTARLGWAETQRSVRENAGNLVLTVSRIGNTSQAVAANVLAITGTAQSGVDFGAPYPASLSWAANDLSDRTVVVPIIYRSGVQSTRAFTVRLQATSGATQVLSPDVVNVSIADVDCASDTPIGFGETKSGVIDAALPANYCHGGARGSDYNTVRYSFEGQAGDIVSIDLTSTTASPEILDTYLFLLDPNRVVIAQNDDVVPNQNRNSRLSSILLTQSGTHYIEATTWHPTVDATGTYDLVLHCGAYTAGTSCSVDADGDGLVRVADGLLLMRRFAGASNLSLTGGMAFGSCATRTTGAAIAAFADPQTLATSSLPALDIDGDGKVLATTDGLLLVRALLGLTGDAVVSGALAPTATRSTWPAIRSYLNGQCSLALLP